jgi:putative endonuclease
MPDWYVYLVRCRDGSLYTGITSDVPRRFARHQAGDGAKYLRGRGPLTLVFHRNLGEKGLALSLENKIKKLPKSQKEELVRDPHRIEEIISKL